MVVLGRGWTQTEMKVHEGEEGLKKEWSPVGA